MLCVLSAALQLFADSVPSVPLSTASASAGSLAPLAAAAGGGFTADAESTLDESVWQTLKRDFFTIGRNLRSVLIPVNWDFQNHQAALHNWDLWGPLVSCSTVAGSCTSLSWDTHHHGFGVALLATCEQYVITQMHQQQQHRQQWWSGLDSRQWACTTIAVYLVSGIWWACLQRREKLAVTPFTGLGLRRPPTRWHMLCVSL